MKNLFMLSFLLLLFQNILFAQTEKSYPYAFSDKVMETSSFYGSINNYGGLYSKTIYGGLYSWLSETDSYEYSVYDQGIWVVGKVNNEIQVCFNQWTKTYSPGPIIDGTAAMTSNPADSARYRVYKISKGDSPDNNPDYAEWPEDLGAPMKDGEPFLHGEQSLWTVYNAADETVISGITGIWGDEDIQPLPLEIKQLTYTRNLVDQAYPLSTVLFFEYEIVNHGTVAIDSTFLAFWSDIDFSSPDGRYTNYPGIDTTSQVGYCWAGKRTGSAVPYHLAVGYKFMYGPIVDSPGDTAFFKGRELLDKKNLRLSSFHGIGDDASSDPIYAPPHSKLQMWNTARGFDTEGNPIQDYVTDEETKFPFSGDPNSDTGWTFSKWPNKSGGGAGIVMFSGPFSFEPKDTQWVMIALIPVTGETNALAVSNLIEKANALDNVSYDAIITDIKDDENVAIPKEFRLGQNYPNPFNPTTKIQFQLPEANYVTLKIYDILGREVATLINDNMTAGAHEITFNASRLTSGVYIYTLRTSNFFSSKKMTLIK